MMNGPLVDSLSGKGIPLQAQVPIMWLADGDSLMYESPEKYVTLPSTVNSLINALGAMTSPLRIYSSCRGHFHLPEAFYGMKIGQLLAEIYAKIRKLSYIEL